MEQNEIIKALECCFSNCSCDGCPITELVDCRRQLERNIFALIKELTEECENYKKIAEYQQSLSMDRGFKIKRLTEEVERLSTALANYDRQTEVRISEEYYTAEAYDELREENEKLKSIGISKDIVIESIAKENERLRAEVSVKKKLLKRCSDLVEEIQANTVREFAERLKGKIKVLVDRAEEGKNDHYIAHPHADKSVGYYAEGKIKGLLDIDKFIDQIAKEILNETEEEKK